MCILFLCLCKPPQSYKEPPLLQWAFPIRTVKLHGTNTYMHHTTKHVWSMSESMTNRLPPVTYMGSADANSPDIKGMQHFGLHM